MASIYRLSRLYNRPRGQDGLMGVGKTKLHEDYLLRDASDPLIPGTDVERMQVIPLGEKAVGVVSTEVERVQAGLQRPAKARLADRTRDRDRKPRTVERRRRRTAEHEGMTR